MKARSGSLGKFLGLLLALSIQAFILTLLFFCFLLSIVILKISTKPVKLPTHSSAGPYLENTFLLFYKLLCL